MSHSELPWLLVHTRPGMERTAQFQLERQGYEAYLPLLKECVATPEGLQPRFVPMFPRYLFLAHPGASRSLAPVRSTRGVAQLVSFGDGPAGVDEAVVAQVRQAEAARREAELEAFSPLKPGARVRLRAGALKGLEGLVLASGAKRVSFLMHLLGREKTLTVGVGEVELA